MSCAPCASRARFTRHAEGSVLVEFGDTRVLCTASRRAKVPPFLQRQGAGLGHGRVRHAAARDAHAHAARGGARQAERPHAGDPAADRPQRCAPSSTARRSASAPITHRLRRAAGRRRHAHGRDHRRLRRARATRATLRRKSAQDRAQPDCTGRSRPCRSASSTACRCSTSTTPRTPTPRPT